MCLKISSLQFSYKYYSAFRILDSNKTLKFGVYFFPMSKSNKAKIINNTDPLNYLSSNIILLSFDKNYNIISANYAFQDLSGLNSDQLKTKNFQADFCSFMPEYTKDEICYLLERNKSWQGNFLLQPKTGEKSWFNSNIFPVNNEEGEFIGYTFLATLEKPQQDLISSQDTAESWMKAIFNDPKQVNILISSSGEIIDFNAKAYLFIQWYSGKALETDKMIVDYFNPPFSKTFLALFDKARNGQKQKFIRSFQNTAGFNKIVEIELRPVVSQKDDIMGVIMLASDISSNIAKENRMRLSEKKLDEIAFTNAHELRAPLASILGLINLLDLANVDENSKIILSHLKKASNDLETIIHKVSESTYLDDKNEG